MPMPGDIIRTDEIANVFSDEAIAKLAKRVGLPGNTDVKRLATGVRASAAAYAGQAREASPNTVFREVSELARAAGRGDYRALARAYDDLPEAAWLLLNERSERLQQRAETDQEALAWKLPDRSEFRDPHWRQAAAETIYKLAVTGGGWAKGRKRPGDKQSLEFRRSLHAPEPSRSEPRRAAERNFLMMLRANYYDATKRMPPNTARRDMGGPFARFFAECLCMVRAPVTDEDPDRAGLAVQLINDFGHEYRVSKLADDLQRLLDPLRHHCPVVTELGRLVEYGQATIWRIPLGADTTTPIPDAPALIEFEETENLCFYISQSRWQTIQVKPALRASIMRLAEDLSAATTRERGARQHRRKATTRTGPRSVQ